MTVVRRLSVLEVHLREAGATTAHGLARDEVLGSQVVAEVDLHLTIAADGTLTQLESPPDLLPLVGQASGSGFRRRLHELPADTADRRLAHRVLDDLPILLRVAFQTAILDHPALARPPAAISLAGADQCEGWRSDGTMLAQIAEEGGVLQMALTAPVDDSTGPWAVAEHTALPPMATRRRRLVEIHPRSDGLDLVAHFRDSYTDPDGIERGLHGYVVTGHVAADGTIEALLATGVVLPGPECWRATASTERLLGVSLRDVDQVAKTDLLGRGTCTHLNDTLRALADVAELAAVATVR
jgi:hypothetical protein